MSDRTDGRLSLAVLAAGAALVTAAGTAWWVAAAPPTVAKPAAMPPAAVAPELTAPEHRLNDLESLLPPLGNTLHREVFRLHQDETHVLTFTAEKDGTYLVQYVCLGEGELLLRIQGTTGGSQLHHADCAGDFTAYQVVAANPTVVVEVTRPNPEPAVVGVQIVDAD